MPVTQNYILSMIYFFAQGVAQAVYDLGGNYIILNLWDGINTSPINAMHAGYGIGAILAIQLAKPFISFDPYHVNDEENILASNISFLNKTAKTTLTSNDINLKVPYWIATFVALVLAILFIFSQFFENNIRREHEKYHKQLILLTDDLESTSIGSANSINQSKITRFLQKLFFGKKSYNGKMLFYMVAQIILFMIVFIFNQGYFTVISRFMLTYLTKGPAKLHVEIFVIIQTLFWAFFIGGRFFAAYLAFKLESIKFFFGILIVNLVICFLFLIPFLTNFKIFFWIGVSLLGLTSGPMTPTGLMVAKHLLNINSFVLSLFIVGLAIGGIIFQQITGAFLDYFVPSSSFMGFDSPSSPYIIPHLAFISSFLCVLFFVPIYFLYRKFSREIKN